MAVRNPGQVRRAAVPRGILQGLAACVAGALLCSSGAAAVLRALHAIPSRVGELADQAEVGQLVLSHFMAHSLADIEAGLAAVEVRYDGPVHAANDLSCVTLP